MSSGGKIRVRAILKESTTNYISGGGGGFRPHLLTPRILKLMTTKLNGQIVRPKMFPLRSTTSADDVI